LLGAEKLGGREAERQRGMLTFVYNDSLTAKNAQYHLPELRGKQRSAKKRDFNQTGFTPVKIEYFSKVSK
jgi:hypothetical protein